MSSHSALWNVAPFPIPAIVSGFVLDDAPSSRVAAIERPTIVMSLDIHGRPTKNKIAMVVILPILEAR